MMRFKVLFFTFVGGFIALTSIFAHIAEQPFTLTLAAVHSEVKVGAEARVQITLTNTSSRAISLPRSNGDAQAEFHYTIEIRNAKGALQPETDYLRNLRHPGNDPTHLTVTFGGDMIDTLSPGATLKEEAIITRLYDLGQPGKYVVQVMRDVPQELGKGTIKSNTIVITIEK